MATAGMGDVLAGMIAGLKVQNYSSFDAAIIGVTLHSYTADYLIYNLGYMHLVASDIYKPMGFLYINHVLYYFLYQNNIN
jgi:NAD(P)H-hydrate repair Nnr-like enzyme with NAD(P)H-hydrate dehydratase domain